MNAAAQQCTAANCGQLADNMNIVWQPFDSTLSYAHVYWSFDPLLTPPPPGMGIFVPTVPW
jgi:hypothetical protein